MLKACLLCCGLLPLASSTGWGQQFIFRPGESLLYFRKNRHREAAYQVNDALSCTVKGSRAKLHGRIRGFEGDSVLLLDEYRLNVRHISTLYVDDKTRIWFIFRYKYEKLGYLAGGLFFPLNTLNSGQVQPRALAISGVLLGAGLLARLLISQQLKIKGRRRLLIISN